MPSIGIFTGNFIAEKVCYSVLNQENKFGIKRVKAAYSNSKLAMLKFWRNVLDRNCITCGLTDGVYGHNLQGNFVIRVSDLIWILPFWICNNRGDKLFLNGSHTEEKIMVFRVRSLHHRALPSIFRPITTTPRCRHLFSLHTNCAARCVTFHNPKHLGVRSRFQRLRI